MSPPNSSFSRNSRHASRTRPERPEHQADRQQDDPEDGLHDGRERYDQRHNRDAEQQQRTQLDHRQHVRPHQCLAGRLLDKRITRELTEKFRLLAAAAAAQDLFGGRQGVLDHALPHFFHRHAFELVRAVMVARSSRGRAPRRSCLAR